mmetsp:Transcript_30325/g.75790  ORF Transcript_30325/g.75790 Transcript_30325/m.75790 type:complete len:268 (+) Transcript_30325:230-1033(+)
MQKRPGGEANSARAAASAEGLLLWVRTEAAVPVCKLRWFCRAGAVRSEGAAQAAQLTAVPAVRIADPRQDGARRAGLQPEAGERQRSPKDAAHARGAEGAAEGGAGGAGTGGDAGGSPGCLWELSRACPGPGGQQPRDAGRHQSGSAAQGHGAARRGGVARGNGRLQAPECHWGEGNQQPDGRWCAASCLRDQARASRPERVCHWRSQCWQICIRACAAQGDGQHELHAVRPGSHGVCQAGAHRVGDAGNNTVLDSPIVLRHRAVSL